MKIQSTKEIYRSYVQKVFISLTLCTVIAISGCDILGVLAKPGAFEKKIPPQYDLPGQQDRKILLWVECPRSSGVDFDVQEKLKMTCQFYLTEKMKIRPENIILERSESKSELTLDPLEVAREKGAGYVLLIQVETYELVRMNVREYYSGQMISRTVLMDSDLGMAVWPRHPAGKVVHASVDLETRGRDKALSRLLSATTHCAMRYLYPCEKLKFKIADEKITIQDAVEMETY